jgi:hypothetical protein
MFVSPGVVMFSIAVLTTIMLLSHFVRSSFIHSQVFTTNIYVDLLQSEIVFLVVVLIVVLFLSFVGFLAFIL